MLHGSKNPQNHLVMDLLCKGNVPASDENNLIKRVTALDILPNRVVRRIPSGDKISNVEAGENTPFQQWDAVRKGLSPHIHDDRIVDQDRAFNPCRRSREFFAQFPSHLHKLERLGNVCVYGYQLDRKAYIGKRGLLRVPVPQRNIQPFTLASGQSSGLELNTGIMPSWNKPITVRADTSIATGASSRSAMRRPPILI